MSLLNLLKEKIADPQVAENFRRVQNFLNGLAVAKAKFRFYEINVSAAVTAMKIQHRLSFKPQDVITLSVTNGVTVTWLYDKFTETDIYLTATGATKIRAFIGAYKDA